MVVPYTAGEDSHYLTPSYLTPSSRWDETWTFDPGTGFWRKEASAAASDLIVCGVDWRGSDEWWPTPGRAVFDDVSGLWVFSRPHGTVMTTLPRLCPLSTYLCASTMSSRG